LSRFGSRRRLLALSVVLASSGTMVAAAVAGHWPQMGGDTGRSGYQPVQEAGLPLAIQWTKTVASDRNVKTSIVATAPSTAAPSRAVYGTQNADPARARVHLQRLDTGLPIGGEDGVAIDDGDFDGDTFGGSAGSVTPVDTSTTATPGNIFVVHNDDNQGGGTADPRTGSDIALAQILVASGLKRSGSSGDVRLGHDADPGQPNTIGFTIESSPVITAPDPDGRRTIFFTAFRPAATACGTGGDWETSPAGCEIDEARRLFRVVISNAGTQNATISPLAMSADIPDLQYTASPTLANLEDANGVRKPYVLVGTTRVLAFDPDTLTEFAASPVLGDAVMTPSVPVNENGSTPSPAPAIFAAADEAAPGDDTIAYRLTQSSTDPTALEFDPSTGRSPGLDGAAPSRGLAVSKLADSTRPGRVFVITSAGVFSLDADNLRNVQGNVPTTPPGALRATPAASGDLLVFARDNGDQVVFDTDTMNEAPGTAGGFVEDPANAPAGSAWGQPAISDRLVAFGSSNGVFVYQAGNPAPPPAKETTAYGIGNSSVTEGNAGEALMTFKVTRYGPAREPGTVTLSTQDGSARAGEDYTAVGGQVVSFAAGETEKVIGITVLSDTEDESDETFFVNLGAPTGKNASIIDDQGLGVIFTDDPRRTHPGEPIPLVAITDVAGVEGSSLVFTVTLTNAASRAVQVDFATADHNARAGADYGGGAGTLTFQPGETAHRISVPLVADNDTSERVEVLYVNLSNPRNAGIADSQGMGSILERNYDLVRVPPRSVTASTTPKRDTTAPFRFTTKGRVTRPSGIGRALGCTGRVAVQIKSAPAKTISNRRVSLRDDCTFRSSVTFRNGKRFAQPGIIEVRARFLGNDVLSARNARVHRVRTK
jgi:hypothetical protein